MCSFTCRKKWVQLGLYGVSKTLTACQAGRALTAQRLCCHLLDAASVVRPTKLIKIK